MAILKYQVEFLIVGQGLAGTALAWELLWRGRDVLVIDAEEAVTSSKVAAGLVTPITGQRLTLSWRVHEILPRAEAFYQRVQESLGKTFFHKAIIRRLLRSPDEINRWHKRRIDPSYQTFIIKEFPPALETDTAIELKGAYLDCSGYLAASRSHFQKCGCYQHAFLSPEEAADFPAHTVIFCQGHAASRNPYFPWLAWKSAKGEILTLQADDAAAQKAVQQEPRILSAGQWVLKLPNGFARTGSTYEWGQLDTQPTAAGRQQLEQGFSALLPGTWKTIAHHAAVRPIIRESKALIGRHPSHDRLAFFNGLGSKGSLHAPFFAAQLASHLTQGTTLEEECDLRRNH